jgi:hypothetical protein
METLLRDSAKLDDVVVLGFAFKRPAVGLVGLLDDVDAGFEAEVFNAKEEDSASRCNRAYPQSSWGGASGCEK